MIDMDRVTAQALAELERTDVGITLVSWMESLVEDRKERLVGHRGIASIPDMWHDQGFIEGIRVTATIFDQARSIVASEEDSLELDIPDPVYLGASANQPRR